MAANNLVNISQQIPHLCFEDRYRGSVVMWSTNSYQLFADLFANLMLTNLQFTTD